MALTSLGHAHCSRPIIALVRYLWTGKPDSRACDWSILCFSSRLCRTSQSDALLRVVAVSCPIQHPPVSNSPAPGPLSVQYQSSISPAPVHHSPPHSTSDGPLHSLPRQYPPQAPPLSTTHSPPVSSPHHPSLSTPHHPSLSTPHPLCWGQHSSLLSGQPHRDSSPLPGRGAPRDQPRRWLSMGRRQPPWRTMFFGTDDYALHHLKALDDSRKLPDDPLIDRLEVVVPNNRCAVSEYAHSQKLKCHDWSKRAVQSAVSETQFDVGVIVSFGHLIPKRLIDAFPHGIVNVHPSILPRWRGTSPILHTILNGDRETGISIMEIRPLHFDIGPLLNQVKYPVPDNCTSLQLRDYLAVEGSNLLLLALRDLLKLENLEYEQERYGVTYAHKLGVKNAGVNWEQQTCCDIDRQFRALAEIFGLRSRWLGKPVRLLDMVPLDDMRADDIEKSISEAYPNDLMCVRPGIAHYCHSRELLCIRCTDGWVGFHGITFKKQMSAKSFYNGYLSRAEHRATAFDCLDNELDRHSSKSPDILQPIERLHRIRLSR